MNEKAGDQEYRAYGYRWVVLLAFGLVLCVQAFLWISFAPIESSVEKVFGVGSGLVRLLALVGPLMFVFLGSLAGDMADKRGFKFTVSLGAVVISLAGIFRAVVPHLSISGKSQYWIILVCQAVIGGGAVFILVNMSKMPIKWFLEEARATAIGITTVFFYLGSAVGIPLVTAIAGIPEGTTDLALMTNGVNRVLNVFAIIMAASTALFIALARENPPTPSGPVPEEAKLGVFVALKRFLAAPTFQALALVSLIGYGAFVGLTVTMEKIIGYHGFSSSFASFVASALIVGGIIGAGILPGLSEKIGLRKPFLILAALVTVPMGFLIGFVGVKALNLAGAFLLGFFLLSALPVTFTIVSEMEEIGPVFAGSAVGTLMALGNIGSLIIPLAMEALKRGGAENPDYRVSLLMLFALAILGMLVVIWRVKETGPRAKGAKG
ncbi:MAG: MFS transporter [Actinobacteria bacterium]|nr:MFS transporter [Actinomycetota bacterium]